MKPRIQPQQNVKPNVSQRMQYLAVAATVTGFLLVIIALIVYFSRPTASIANNLPGYNYKKIVTVQAAEVPGTSDLVDFPVMIKLTDNDLRTVSNGGYVEHVDGYDIRAALADGTTLHQQMESYNPTTGEVVLWVRVPALSATSNTDIHLFFGNSSITTDPSTHDTWSGQYNGVYHFNNSYQDNSGNGFNGTPNNTDPATGIAAGGVEFDGNNDHVDIDSDLVPDQGAWTISMWVQPNTVANSSLFDIFSDDGGDKYYYVGFSNNELRWYYEDEDDRDVQISYSTSLTTNWHQIVVIGEWNENSSLLYLDGQLVASSTTAVNDMFDDASDIRLGDRNDNYAPYDEFDGVMDELRVLNVRSTAEWIEAEYNNLHDPNSFYTVSNLINLAGGGSGGGGGGAGGAGSSCSYSASTLADFTHRTQLTINAGLVAGSGNHSHFPVWINIMNDDLRTVGNGGHMVSTSGYDVAFTAADGTTQLDFEIESYDASTGELQAWVSVPSLSTSNDTELFLYFGNDQITSDPSSTQVWQHDYSWVSHYNGDLLDNSGNSNDGTNYGSQSAEGISGNARTFDGNNDRVDHPDQDFANGTFSFWFRPDNTINSSLSTSQTLVAKYQNNSNHFTFVLAGSDNDYDGNSHGVDAGELYFKIEGDGFAVEPSTTSTWTAGNWYYVVGTWGNNHVLYINGVEEGHSTANTSLGNNADFDLGRGIVDQCGGNNRAFDGRLDEVRLSSTVRSEDWIETEYQNMANYGSFISTGCVEDLSAVDPTAGYGHAMTITIDQNVVCGSSNLQDFPYLIQITDMEIASTSFGGNVQHADGYDIIFCAITDTTRLHFILEEYDEQSGELKAWVQLPTLFANQDTELLMYYGNSTVNEDQSTPATFDSKYAGVWNFKENSLHDATSNDNDGNDNNSQTATGYFGQGRYFDGSHDYITVPNSSSLNIDGGELTLQAWVRAPIPNNDDSPFIVKGSQMNQEQYMLGVDGGETNNNINTRVTTVSNHYRDDSGQLPDDTWTHVTFVYNRHEPGNQRKRIFVDGSLVATHNGANDIEADNGDLYIGRRIPGDNRFFEGTLDEIRVVNEALSDCWIQTEYNNQSDPANNITWTGFTPGGNLLPIELGYFEATPTADGQVELAWETLIEINNEYFTIERSKDGEHFEPILTEPGQVNSSTPTQYVRFDEDPFGGYSYYRLKQTDLDGKYEYFPIQQVFIAPEKDGLQVTRVYPNPFQQQVQVEVLADRDYNVEVLLVDMQGRVRWQRLLSVYEGEQRLTLTDMSRLAAGNYLLYLRANDFQTPAVRLTKVQ